MSKKIIIYSSLFITAAVNLPRLLLLPREEGLDLMPLNWIEWFIRLIIVFVFCVAVFYFNGKHFDWKSAKWGFEKQGYQLFLNLLMLLLFIVFGGLASRVLVHNKVLPLNGYLFRLSFVGILLFIELKILSALYKAAQKEKENEQLRYANIAMELELLKSQINPHFLFNALSSLSGIMREEPDKAQQYINHTNPRHPLLSPNFLPGSLWPSYFIFIPIFFMIYVLPALLYYQQ